MTSDSITVLSGLEAVRRRPGMYVGDIHDGSGLHHLVWEVVENALAEHVAGHATRVRVSVEGGLAEVEDDGRGIPVGIVPSCGVSAVEVVLTQLFAGGSGLASTRRRGCSFSIGLAIVNALSEELEIEVRRDGYRYQQRFARGTPLGPLERGARTERTGTRIRFRADREIFGSLSFDRAAIRERLEELAFFHAGLTLELMCQPMHESGGLAAWVEHLAREDESEVSDVFVTQGVRDQVSVQVALGWSDASSWQLRSFVNQAETHEGGSHERGFWRGLVLAVAGRSSRACSKAPKVGRLRERLAPGLIALVNVELEHPRYDQCRQELQQPEVSDVVRDQVVEAYAAHLAEHPELARRLLARIGA